MQDRVTGKPISLLSSHVFAVGFFCASLSLSLFGIRQVCYEILFVIISKPSPRKSESMMAICFLSCSFILFFLQSRVSIECHIFRKRISISRMTATEYSEFTGTFFPLSITCKTVRFFFARAWIEYTAHSVTLVYTQRKLILSLYNR